jgi:hypothetical protein
MVSDNIIGNRFKGPPGTRAAANFRLFTDASYPFIPAGRLVTGLSGLLAFKTPGIDIIPTPEQGTEQGDFGFRRGVIVDYRDVRLRWGSLIICQLRRFQLLFFIGKKAFERGNFILKACYNRFFHGFSMT